MLQRLDKTEHIVRAELDRLVVAIRKRLELQGHNNTGRLRDSIEGVIMRNGVVLEAGIQLFDYWQKVNDGQTPAEIKAKGLFVHYRDLEIYFNDRGFAPAIASIVAQRTLKVHLEEGSPTYASRRFSKNRRRIGFFTDVIDEEVEALEKAIESGVMEDIDTAMMRTIETMLELV